ncbi:MAG: zinc ribbon domain-containing protein, partial [Acidobacteriota bacterium]
FFDDELVCASVGVKASLMRGVEPFPTTNHLVPYSAGFVTGWTVERYQIDLIGAAKNSRAQMEGELRALCAAAVPGDTQRNLQIESRWNGQTFKHILVPTWLLTYHYGARPYQVIINGCTGRIAGEYPKSWIKIALAVVAALIVVTIVMLAGRR